MIKIFKHKYLTNALVLIMGAMILISPLVAYAANPPSGYWQEGRVVGDGVRHRRTPGDDGEILGLMYTGEVIYLSNEVPPSGLGMWVAMWREKTDQKGWMEWSYFDHNWP